ncbi:DUF4954 family protein [uncultured Muribaculum sp.]|uniref:DUF4954 family protein n=1 Tax=uncultured Muribaculum sp. TaxID=1918613 RepID=UPI0025DF410B|nr:DUF4954 family protein [uncultured Muribaculum sp.]
MANFRELTIDEITQLRQNGCHSNEWVRVKVADPFRPDNYHDCVFMGDIRLGITEGTLRGVGGLDFPTGIYGATLRDCEIGDNVRISHVRECIVNYLIGANTCISNVGSIICNGRTAFGNGVKVNVMEETGSRTNLIYDKLSAQISFLQTIYADNRQLIEALHAMIRRYAEEHSADRGEIGAYVTITDTTRIQNVRILNRATISGASALINGTVGFRATVGCNVIAENFIISSEAVVDNSVLVHNSFVGQACQLRNGFTAHDSVFFANCHMECGESCSIYAGPHCVSHHKSTLLIAGYYAFFNAGSNSNQSNHLYRTGPIHHGILEHGCKTGSNSYIIWPARFGDFTLVLGKHSRHPDTSALPYSYAIGQPNGETLIYPGANVKTAGTIRDILKWRIRDKRSHDIPKLDYVNTVSLSPVTALVLYRALRVLEKIEADDNYDYPRRHNFRIKREYIRKGREYYALAIDYFMGETIVNKLLHTSLDANSPLWEQLREEPVETSGDWADVVSLIMPEEKITDIFNSIIDGRISSVEQLAERLNYEGSQYDHYAWAFVCENFRNCYSVDIKDITPEILISVINRWTDSVRALDQMRREDALRDFSQQLSNDNESELPGEWQGLKIDDTTFNPESNSQIMSMHNHYVQALLDAHQVTTTLRRTFSLDEN